MITILCSGSRGDFQPYIALAMELKKLGKDVQITGSRSFEDFIRSYGIDYYPIQSDMESLNVDKRMLRAAQTSDNPLKMLLTFNKMKKYGAFMTQEYYSACEGSELVIYHPGVTIGYFTAKKLGIPSVLASPFPMHKTKEHTSVILYGRLKSTPAINKISYSLLQSMLWLLSKDSVKSFWKERFGNAPDSFRCPYEQLDKKKHIAVISCSNYVYKRPKDWNENIHQNGYWFVEEQNDYIPSKELTDFLDSDDKPIYIGFGSVFNLDEKAKLSQLVIEALQKSGKRGILCGMGELHNLPENVFALDSIPHSWLFGKVSAVCHHGGAGTTAAGFKAGIPSIIIPSSNDQFAWAHRAYDLGVGAKPIPMKRLTADKLCKAISYALQNEIVANAKTLAMSIAEEKGASACAKIISGILNINKPM